MGYKTIIGTIQEKVDVLTKTLYRHDKCPPEFIVSLMYDRGEHTILLTVRHLGSTFTTVIFPNYEYEYGYESLSKEMEYLYNRTM